MKSLRRYRLTSSSGDLDEDVWAIQYNENNLEIIKFLGVDFLQGDRPQPNVVFHESHFGGVLLHSDWVVQGIDAASFTVMADDFFASHYTLVESENSIHQTGGQEQ